MAIFRVMIPDTFINVEAETEAEAEDKVSAHIAKNPPKSKNSLIEYISWVEDDGVKTDI